VIGVVDYRAGNAPSVMYALARLGLDARLVSDGDALAIVDHLILPGVGAARATLGSLDE
jgi:glutamine amidotransferase